jgi:actin-like ATPase involved in cell morphogenesis
MSGAGHFQLGVDLGTTWTAAAVARNGQVRMVGLGNRSAAIPSVVHQAHDGTTLTGDAADRRGPSEPLRVAREFKRRLGDPTPVLLGGTPYSAEALLGTLLDAVVTRVMEREGGPPTHLTVTHPANWGPYKTELFEQAVRMAGIPAATTLAEPEAAAVAYAANERVEPGALVAVYDLGGGTFDTAILRKTTDGFAILGRPAGIERLGGIDYDEAVVSHVRATLGPVLDRIDPTDPAVLSALTRLRRECVDAKEALSSDTEATIPVLLPGLQTEVRLTRGEFEAMIRPTLHATVEAMRRTMAAAAVEAYEISAVLLVGGSSRIPLVAELVSEAFGRPVAVDAHPKHAVALGAARAAALAADDHPDDAHEARVIPFAAAAGDVTCPVARITTDEPLALSEVIAAGIAGQSGHAVAHAGGARVAGRPSGSGGHVTRPPDADGRGPRSGVAVADRPSSGPYDLGPYDDVPEEVPDWLVDARENGGGTRRRLVIGLLASVALGVLAVGISAFIASEPRSEAVGDITTTLPEPRPGTGIVADADGRDGIDVGAAATDERGDHDSVSASRDTAAADADGGTADEGTATAGGDATDAGDAGTAASGGGPTAPSTAPNDPAPVGGGNTEPVPPAGSGGGGGASEPSDGGTTDDPPAEPTPTPDPPTDDDDVPQPTPQASESPTPSTSPANT